MHAQLANASIAGVLKPRCLTAKVKHNQFFIQICAPAATTSAQGCTTARANSHVGCLGFAGGVSEYFAESTNAVFVGC